MIKFGGRSLLSMCRNSRLLNDPDTHGAVFPVLSASIAIFLPSIQPPDGGVIPRHCTTGRVSPGINNSRCAHHGAIPFVITRSWNCFRSKAAPRAAA